MASLCNQLRLASDAPVLDKTGLAGAYTFKLDWSPNEAPADAPGPPPLPMALRALGLRLQASRDLFPVLIIEHAEKPSAN